MKRLADRLASPPQTARLGYSSSPVVQLPDSQSSASQPQSIAASSGAGRTLSLGEQLVAQLPAECVKRITAKAGSMITRAGDPLHSVFLIRQGWVKTEYVLPTGQYQVLGFLYPGDLFGSDGMVTGQHHYDRIALTEVELCSIAFDRLTDHITGNHDLQLLYERTLSLVIVRTQDHVFSLGKHSTEQKLAFFLLDFQDRHPSYSKTLRLPMGREDLSSYLGVTIESLSRAFAFLERNQLAQVSNRLLTDLHVEGLVRLLA